MAGIRINHYVLITFIVLLVPSIGTSEEAWEFDRLWDEAELVVIAEALSPVVVPNRNSLPKDQVEMEVKLRIESVLKGVVDRSRQHKLTYVRRQTSAKVIANYSDLVDFPTLSEQDLERLERLATPRITYLMFLKRDKDDNLRVVSGDLNSAKSVSKLSTYADNPRAFEAREGLQN